MLAGGLEICAFGYCTGPEIFYDQVLAPVGREIAEDAAFVRDYYAEDWTRLPRNFGIGAVIPLVIAAPQVALPVAAAVGLAACGSEPAKPAPQDVPAAQPDQAQAPQPAPVFPQYGSNPNYYGDVYRYLAHFKQQDPGFSYRLSSVPDIEPYVPISQGAFDLLCYGAYNGKIDMPAGDASLGTCDKWLIPGASAMTHGNNIFYYDAQSGAIESGKPEVAYIAALLGQPAPGGIPAPVDIEHKLLQVSDDFGAAVRIAYENQQSSKWISLRPSLVTQLQEFFTRSSDTCYATQNEGQDLFNRMKMLLANTASFETVWSGVNSDSAAKIAEGHIWMVPMLEAGAILQMMSDISKAELLGLENGNELFQKAVDAYNKARELCPTCLPDINDPQVEACIKDLDPDTMGMWDAPTLVAWQLIQTGKRLSEGSGTIHHHDHDGPDGGTDTGPADVVHVDSTQVDMGGRGPTNPWAVTKPDAGSQ